MCTWVAKMTNEYDWVLEGITLGVVLTSTAVWFYLNWRVLPPRPTEKLHNDLENC